MDKYEYKVRSEEILKLIEEENYVEAVTIADTIDWRRVKSISMLLRVAALYRVNRRNEDSRAVLQLAYDRYPTNRSVVYSLCEISIDLDDIVAAIEYYKEFVKLAPRDNGVFTLRYRILEAQEASLEERIELLEELKKRDYREEWAYELAYLYHRVGLATKCVEECDDLILWFGKGPYIIKAMELKRLHAPLTAIQQKNYDMAKLEQEKEELSIQEDASQETYEPENGSAEAEYAQDEYTSAEYDANVGYAEDGYAQDEYASAGYDENVGYAEDGYAQDEYASAEYDENSEYTQEEQQSTGTETLVSGAYTDTSSIDMSQYNTINLQKVVAESMRELFPDDTDIFEQEKALQQQETIPDPVEPSVRVSTGRVAQLVTGVSEMAPEPNTGAIKKVFVPGNDARVIKQDTNMEELRETTEEAVMHEQLRIEESGENIFEEPQEAEAMEIQEETPFRPITGQMKLEEVLSEWERMKKENEQKRKEGIRQLVLQQTGKIFADFDQSIKSGILGELEEDAAQIDLQEPIVVTETILDDDETEELEELEEAEESELTQEEMLAYENDFSEDMLLTEEEIEEAESADELLEDTYEAEEISETEVSDEIELLAQDQNQDTEKTDSAHAMLEELVERELVGHTETIPQEELEEALAEQDEMQEAAAPVMNTEEISSLPDKILETTKKETKGIKKGQLREFTQEEKDLFENYAVNKKVKRQIIYALDKMSLASYTGNVLITGEAGLGTIRLAKNLIREFQASDSNFSGKVAKITGERLNNKDLQDTFTKLNNGALIVEKANGMTEETLYSIATLLNQENLGIVVVMEDTKKEITRLLEKQAMITDYFNIRIDLLEMDNNALVAFARKYAQEQEYSIDELGTLALYTRIANSQSGNHVVTKDEVREMVDEAIWKSKRLNLKNFIDVLFARRFDQEDMIVLRERDFM